MLLHLKNVIHIRIFGTTYILKKKRENEKSLPAFEKFQAGLAVVCSALIKRSSASWPLVAFSTCSEAFSPSISETRRHWLRFFSLFRAFWMMPEVCCGYWDSTLVIQRSESPVEDEPRGPSAIVQLKSGSKQTTQRYKKLKLHWNQICFVATVVRALDVP